MERCFFVSFRCCRSPGGVQAFDVFGRQVGHGSVRRFVHRFAHRFGTGNSLLPYAAPQNTSSVRETGPCRTDDHKEPPSVRETTFCRTGWRQNRICAKWRRSHSKRSRERRRRPCICGSKYGKVGSRGVLRGGAPGIKKRPRSCDLSLLGKSGGFLLSHLV